MIRMYGRECARRALSDSGWSILLAGIVFAGTQFVVATLVAGWLLTIRAAVRWFDARRLIKRIAYVDLTVVPTGNQPTERRRPPRNREYVN